MKVVIADTCPILHLHQAGALHLLASLEQVFVVPKVMEELARHAPTVWENGFPAWLHFASPTITSSMRAAKWVEGEMLDPGEEESLAIAEEISPDLFLTDDTAARLMAEGLGLVARGSLGVVLYCAAKGNLPEADARARLDALYANSTLWLSETVKKRADGALAQIFATDL